ncbi:MAG: FAD-binding and (Fe-S)-binding domain-containing protein [Chloroflexota bacterium]
MDRGTAVRSPEHDVDSAALAADLTSAIRGEVRFDAGSRALYSTDSSNYRQIPLGLVLPRDADDVIAAVAICRRYRVPVLPRGGGTSLAGQTCNVAVVLDFSKYMNRILEIDPVRGIARVEPGVVLDDLRNAAEHYHLTYGPDPATHDRCTLGGMIGNNSCGVHSVTAGMTDENVEEMDILTYEGLRLRVGTASEDELEQIITAGGSRGQIYSKLRALRDRYAPLIRERYPDIPRRVSGYNLTQLLPENGFHVARALVGSEGTCVTVLEATVRLVQIPPGRVLVVLGYPDVYTACDQVPEILTYKPIGLEGFDDRLIEDMHLKSLKQEDIDLLPAGGGWLLVEFGADQVDQAKDQADRLVAGLKGQDRPPNIKLFSDQKEQLRIWGVREAALGATAVVPSEPPAWPGWEDAAVAPEKLGNYLREFSALVTRYHYNAALYGHFGQGCTHTRVDFDLVTAEGIRTFRSFIEDAADLVLKYGGSLSGEHGDGQARAELLPKMFGPELVRAFGEFKAIWDPTEKMNPGKVVHPYRLDQNLRLGTDYHPPRLKTHFSFVEDRGNFAQATLRCVGVGKCRKHEEGTMCPSYMVTREEMHSTRGRARLLFEMLQGNPLRNGWRDEHVKEALDLCLACKGCRAECPVQVDMATYKAEFLSHYYAGRIRPVTAYTMGLIYWGARFASRMPAVANFFTQTPMLRDITKRLGGVAPERQIPAFAPQTFKQWFKQRAVHNEGKAPVILWPDTFNNHFFPGTAKAAVEVLEAAGYQVLVPERSLCCGRPLYDYGFLDQARRQLRQILDTLEPQIRAGIPLVGLEPSCLAVFRDELVNLFPNDEDAKRLCQQSFLLSEFLMKHADGYQPPTLRRTALVQGHCHHKAIMTMADEEVVLEKMGLDYQVLDSGCCGMAGAFGFERDHYDISVKCGERVLLPAVRAAADDTLIIADGFSCREQIAQTTNRRALHLAEVLQMAGHDGEQLAIGGIEGLASRRPPVARVGAALIGAGVVLGGIAWGLARRSSE